MFISERFRKIVLLHLLKNISNGFKDSPLLLGIQGPPGEGKTFQISKLFEINNFEPVYISVGQLESKDAGEPARLIRAKYLECGRIQSEQKKLSALIINDIDTGIGNFGSLVQTTINTQQLNGQLMDLADRPTIVDSIQTKRIPIILTGNDFSKIYEPLLRTGRMTNFEWMPNKEEKLSMINNILPHLLQQQVECIYNALMEHNENKRIPISFFSHLESSMNDEIIWDTLKKGNILELIPKLIDGAVFSFSRCNDTDLYIENGKSLLTTINIKNHLN